MLRVCFIILDLKQLSTSRDFVDLFGLGPIAAQWSAQSVLFVILIASIGEELLTTAAEAFG